MYISVHTHSYYSLLDGESSPLRLATRAKELGMPALCLTDHNHLLGAIDFKDSCEKVGIDSIIGCELYYTPDTSILSLEAKEREKIALKKAQEAGVVIPKKTTKKAIKEMIEPYTYNTKSFHLIFLAKNKKGYLNLVKLQSEAARLCTYDGHYHCDNKLIEQYKEDLIMTTACLGSRTAHHIIACEFEEAEALILEWHALFKDDFYLEMQPLIDEDQYRVNCFYIQMSEKHHIKLIATNDVHYTYESDIDDHDTVLCIGIGETKAKEDRWRYAPEFWLRSEEEMIEAFINQDSIYGSLYSDNYLKHCRQAIDNTEEIYHKCKGSYKLGADFSLFPHFEVPAPFTAESLLRRMTYTNLYKYYASHPEIDLKLYEKRLDFELSVVNTKGFAPYMLVNEELVSWCKTQLIPTGPGRGSAAGSLILFLLEITKLVDPIKENLLFSRFLTKDRKSLPDIDMDFSYLKRHLVIQHLQHKYGEFNVGRIGTTSVLGVKSGLKDFARVLENPSYKETNDLTSEIDAIMDYVPSLKFKDIDKLKDGSERDKAQYERYLLLEAKYPELFRLARKYEGMPRGTSVHASGILVTPVPISDIFPIAFNEDGEQVCLFNGKQLEKFDALKLDVLGLRTLDVINNTIQKVDSTKTIYDFYDNCPVNFYKGKYFKDLCRGDSDAIFQLESGLFKGALKEIMPKNIDDITAITSLLRPGPLSAKLDKIYAKRKNGEEKWGEPLPNTLDIVQDTYGTIIYQEQCMLIAQRVAGFDDNHADSFLRKSMAKKDVELLKLCKRWFTYGKLNKPIPEGYDNTNQHCTMYDPEGIYGAEIKGGIVNGYDEKQLVDFFNSLDGYSAYLFNKSHAFAYSVLSLYTAYLAHYHRAQFMAQVLNMEEKNEKVEYYIDTCNAHGIQILPPDINHSQNEFIAQDKIIFYGLNKITKVGKTAPAIIENRPYNSIEDLQERVKPRKDVFENLIKAGCFDFVSPNRYVLLNRLYDIRKDKEKDVPRLDEEAYTKQVCREFEKDSIKTTLTYPSIYKQAPINEKVNFECVIEKINERCDKNGNTMGFYDLVIDDTPVKALCFAKIHSGIRLDLFARHERKQHVVLSGKIDDKKTFIVNALDANETRMLNPIKPVKK